MNKAGNLIFNKQFVKSNTPLTGDDNIQVASVFHGMHTISSSLTFGGNHSSGILRIEAENMVLQCFQTATGESFLIKSHGLIYIGTKFFITASNTHPTLEAFLLTVYDIYGDFVLKNPFYEMEQPIKNTCDKFVYNLDLLIDKENQEPSKKL